MCKIGHWKTLLFGLALIALLASCARKGTVVVSFSAANNESAWFPVDVANWNVYVSNGGEAVFSHTAKDATADLEATLIDAATGEPSSSRVVHLDSYTVSWDNAQLHIPALHGSLDVTVPADPNSSKPAKFTVLVMPAIEKETLGLLADLRGDPSLENPYSFNGELVTTATIDFRGHDLASDDSVLASLHLTAAFADYQDPNSYH